MKTNLTMFTSIALLALTLSPVTACEDEAAVTAREMTEELKADGYEVSGDFDHDYLGEQQSTSVIREFQAGREVVITVGGCSNAANIDLHLYDADNNLIDADMEIDPRGLVAVSPARTGKFRVVVTMVDCVDDIQAHWALVIGSR